MHLNKQTKEVTGGASVEFTLMVAYKGCVEADLTMDGNITYSSKTASGGGTASSEITMTGTVNYTGSFETSCVFDFKATASAGGGSGEASVSGTVCGVEVGAAGISYSAS